MAYFRTVIVSVAKEQGDSSTKPLLLHSATFDPYSFPAFLFWRPFLLSGFDPQVLLLATVPGFDAEILVLVFRGFAKRAWGLHGEQDAK